jgi:hypothetical protein
MSDPAPDRPVVVVQNPGSLAVPPADTKSREKRSRWRTVAELVAWTIPVSLSIVALIKSCSADRWAQSDKYVCDAEAHRPLLAPDTSFSVSRIRVLEMRPVLDSAGPAIGIVPAITGRITLRNIGNAPSRLLGFWRSDTVAGVPILRQRLLDPKWPLTIVNWTELAYGRDFVLPGETTSVTVDYAPRHPDGDSAVIHSLLLYENESGKLFDTYAWIKVQDFKTRFILTASGDTGIETTVSTRAGQSYNSHVYENHEAQLVRSRFKIR